MMKDVQYVEKCWQVMLIRIAILVAIHTWL